MDYLVKNEKLELKYEPGKGAWTYHIQIPDTKDIVGKWGSLKVSGTIDDYKIERINLFTITGQDKLISINEKIRKAIKKTAGDFVHVTVYLLTTGEKVTEKEILETFKDANVLEAFKKLPANERTEIIGNIISQNSQDKQTRMIIQHMNKLSKK
jgi:hypothetical protein